jgi:DNA repair exonuclease SbcCD ATPase subunit
MKLFKTELSHSKSGSQFARYCFLVNTLIALAVSTFGCKPMPSSGEAFLVMKSSDVKPLADLEVVCLSSSFKSEFEKLRNTHFQNKKQSLSNVLSRDLVVSNKYSEYQESINLIAAEIKAKQAPNSKLTETIQKEVDAEIEKDRATIAAQIKNIETQVDASLLEQRTLADSAQSLFDSDGKTRREKINSTKKIVSELEGLVNEFNMTVADLDQQYQQQSELVEKMKKRVEEVPRIVARLLNKSIRDQRLQTPLINEEKFNIQTKSDLDAPLNSRPGNYIKTTRTWETLGKEFQELFHIPDELKVAATLPEAMVLVREYIELGGGYSGKIGQAATALNEIRKQRFKLVTPWVNLNSEKITELRSRLSLSNSSEPVGRSFGGILDRDSNQAWPPSSYKSAREALAHATAVSSKDQESFASRSFSDFKENLLNDNKNSIAAKKDSIQKLKDELTAIDLTKVERIKSRETLEQDHVKKMTEKLESDLDAKTRELAEFTSGIDEANQRELFRKFVNNVLSLIKENTISSQRTDRNGVFDIPSSANYVWAHLERDNGENHVWLRKVQPDASKKMLLSNSTISGNSDLKWIEDYVVE